MKKFNVAIAGATGAVGEALISILEERDFPVAQLFPLASERSAGSTILFRNKPLKVQNLAEFDFTQAERSVCFQPGERCLLNLRQKQANAVVL